MDELTTKLLLVSNISDNYLINDIYGVIGKNIIDSYYEKIIQLDANKIKLLFWHISRNISLHHILYNGKPYYELSNKWNSSNIKNRPEYDPDIKCNGYFECTASISTIRQRTTDTVEYMYSVEQQPNILENINTEFNEKEISENDKIFLENLIDIDYKKTLITGYKFIQFTNSRGINRDHRGSTHCRINLKFEKQVNINEYITLHDLVQIYYRTKSHKFDTWYELYCGCSVIKKKENFYVNLSHDHGS